ncbi:MAG: 50S ribosomal protein L6 [Patescibacteria group bacterium]
MSRIGKQPINIPALVTVIVADRVVTVTGPRGTLTEQLPPHVTATMTDGVINVTVADPADHRQRAFWGLAQKLIANMVIGVVTGYSKKLEVNGIGFRVALQGQKLVMSLGFSHPVEFVLPAGIAGTVEGNSITVAGADKKLVGQTAANIRKLKKPEPYKGKGIRYSDEVIRRKAGKTAKAA